MSAVAVSVSADLWEVLDPWVKEKPARPPLRAVEPLVPFFCSSCGHEYGVHARQARALRAGTREPLCSFCRRPGDGPFRRQFRVTEADRQFWLERFTAEEILDIAVKCWGPVGEWTDDWKSEFVFEAAL